ncbi:histidine kinase [Bifidobacterium magnum]|nr:histidine kinase [Bifidobacterium magnum]
MAWTVGVFTLLSSLTGYLVSEARTQAKHWRALADGQRERLRLSHMRLDDMRAGRGEDLRRARMEEQVRIAREIHDNVGHTLTSAIMLVQANQVVATAQGDTAFAYFTCAFL